MFDPAVLWFSISGLESALAQLNQYGAVSSCSKTEEQCSRNQVSYFDDKWRYFSNAAYQAPAPKIQIGPLDC